jgi:hypothetical protein
MNINLKIISAPLAAAVLAVSSGVSLASDDNANYCMDVVIAPFHMMPDMQPQGTCTVRDYWGGELQEAFYPFTEEEHLFNCEFFGPLATLPTGVQVPSAVVSQGNIVGTIGGHHFDANLACASLTNWYQDSCTDPTNPMSCTFQMAQPFLTTHPRVTEVSIFDGVITVDSGRRSKEIPIVMATRAAGITHLEDLTAPLVGASITHSLLGMVTYKVDGDEEEGDHDAKVLNGSADLLLQGHIFYPGSVEDDPGAAVIKGSICSKDLYRQLNHSGDRGYHGGRHHDD